MNCYLCNSNSFTLRKGQVRDAPELKIMECDDCGLTTLSSIDHIQDGFYEKSGMHENNPQSMESWLKNTEWDDQRRFDDMKSLIPNKKLLDFGCGAGGFLKKAQQLAESVEGVELEHRVKEYWCDDLKIHSSLESVGAEYDVITAFHVVEHLSDPVALIKILAQKLSKNGRLVIEVPNSEDALLTLYDSDAFQHFTYWSQHLYLFNAENLRKLIHLAGLQVINIEQFQRYPLSNHLYWLSKGKPGGHQIWSFLDSPELKTAYANALAASAKCDTLIAHIELAN